jgi:hypothetical protein
VRESEGGGWRKGGTGVKDCWQKDERKDESEAAKKIRERGVEGESERGREGAYGIQKLVSAVPARCVRGFVGAYKSSVSQDRVEINRADLRERR